MAMAPSTARDLRKFALSKSLDMIRMHPFAAKDVVEDATKFYEFLTEGETKND